MIGDRNDPLNVVLILAYCRDCFSLHSLVTNDVNNHECRNKSVLST